MARLALCLVVAVAVAVPAVAGSGAAPAAAKGCHRYKVGGKRVCLRVRQHCAAGLQSDYLKAKFECRRGRLRRAGPAALRQGEPTLVNARGQIDPRNALEAFDAAVSPLPGVTPRKGAVGKVHDATSVIAAVARQRSRLTLAQRAVLDRVMAADPEASAAAISPAEKASWVALTTESKARLAAHGYPINHQIALSFPASSIEPISGTSAVGYAWPSWLDPSLGTPGSCSVWITPSGRADPLEERRNTITHELFHCAQFEHYTTTSEDNRVPQWVVEGGAEWAGTQIAEEWNGKHVDDDFWAGWLVNPQNSLDQREYSAIGFFFLLQQHGIDVFQRMHAVIKGGASSGQSGAYAAATAGAETAMKAWGPGYLRDQSVGPLWHLTGAGLIKTAPPHFTVANGTTYQRATAEHAGMGVRLDLQADVVTLAPVVGRGLMFGPDGEVPLRGAVYCTKTGGCECEGDSLGAKELPKGIGLPIGWMNGMVVVQGRSIDAECKKRGKGGDKPDGGGQGAGITMFQSSVNEGKSPVAVFRSGSCSVRGGTWRASTSAGGYRLTATIRNFRGFGRHYTVRYHSSNPSFVVTGPHGPFRNTYFPGTPPNGGGAINFNQSGRTVGMGFLATFNASGSDGVLFAGTMACRYPRR